MIKKDGERCGRWSLRGHTHCVKHSGALPNVRAKADAIVESSRLRLMNMTDDAIDVLEELMQPGVADAIRMKAVENVLSRSGLKDVVEMKVEITNNSNPSEEIMKRLQIMRERGETAAKTEEDIVDAEDLTDEGEKQAEAPLHVTSET